MRSTHRRLVINSLAALPLCAAFLLVISGVNHKLQSASLNNVSVTSSNPRPSFRGLVADGTEGTKVVLKVTPGANPSTTSAQLVEGDALSIGLGATLNAFTVASTSSESTFSTTTALSATDDDTDNIIISTSAANLAARFTTVSAIPNGRFRILVPAVTDTPAASDGIPDGGYFDFGSTSSPATVTCPTDVGATYDFVAGTATPAATSGVTLGGVNYHVFECAYSGIGATSQAFNSMLISNIINPAPKANHTTGVADTYNVIIQQLDSTLELQDTTTVQIAVIEAVRVTASVPPQITFKVLGLPAGTSACGLSTNVPTTAASVPLGEVSISDFTNAAQSLSVSTNAAGGYVVTATENDQLGRNGATCVGEGTGSATCIPDTTGDDGAMTPTNADDWVNANLAASKGFGYSLHNVNALTAPFVPAFEYNVNSGSCTGGTYCARQFADAEDTVSAETPETIFSRNTVADNDNLYVCYKIVVSAIQAAGNYENYVTYNATATF